MGASPDQLRKWGYSTTSVPSVDQHVADCLSRVGSSQLEAARSLGLNAAQALRYVVLPQAAVVILPPLGNLAISLTKTTSLVAIFA